MQHFPEAGPSRTQSSRRFQAIRNGLEQFWGRLQILVLLVLNQDLQYNESSICVNIYWLS